MFDYDRSRENLEKHSLDMRQFIDARESTLPNGVRIIDVYNPSGLHLTILPDRGMDIWTAHYKGIPLTWISPGSPHPPDYGSSWLRQFNGGLLTTCGLTHAGPPEVDPITGEQRDLHGNFTRLRAGNVRIEGNWQSFEHITYSLKVEGQLSQSRLFGEQITLERSYTIQQNTPSITIRDSISNLGDTPVPLMIVYHVNIGYPLVGEGTKLYVPAERSIPRDAAAEAGFAEWDRYNAPSAHYAEQVFFHHLRAQRTHENYATTSIVLAHDNFGIELMWNGLTLPYFTQWKNTREGIYVCGIEPGNCVPEGQNAARENGRLMYLAPRESERYSVTISVLDGQEAVQAAISRVNEIRENGTPVEGFRL